MLEVDALMKREEKEFIAEFIAEDLLHVYCIVWPRKNLETHAYEGNHYLQLRKSNQPQMMSVMDFLDKDFFLNDFIWVL